MHPAPSSHMGFWLVLLVLGFLVGTGAIQERIREGAEPARSQELARLVGERQRAIREMDAEVRSLGERLAQEQARLAGESRDLEALIERAADLSIAAAAADMHGPGIVVELADSSRMPTTREQAADYAIQDVELQQVVNDVWRAGAEAVAVNGRRVTATTAIRVAGGRILVNYEAIASPYRVVAIGDPASLARYMEASQVARRFDVWTQAYGLGFSIKPREDLRIPGSRSARELEWATPGTSS